MMRKPGEYVAAALRGLRAGALSGVSSELSVGGATAQVSRVGSTLRGEDAVSNDEIAEAVSVIALAADFPAVRKGDRAELDGRPRIVTSARFDAAGATVTVGLSAALYEDVVTVYGGRPGGRKMADTVPAWIVSDEDADPVSDESLASEVRMLTVAFPDGEWAHYGERLRPGDELGFGGATFRVVSARRDKDIGWTVKAREVA